MKNKLKQSIVLSILPVFVLAGCSSQEDEYTRMAVPDPEHEVTVNDDGSYRQTQELATGPMSYEEQAAEQAYGDLTASYTRAVQEGYVGSLEEWTALAKLYEGDQALAQQQAETAGLNTGQMLVGTLLGVAVAALAANAMSSRTAMANASYSAQRANHQQNYAYSRPHKTKKEQEEEESGVGAGTGRALVSGFSASQNDRERAQDTGRSTAAYGSVTRGGFGGAVGRGG